MQVTLNLGEHFPAITGVQSDEFAAELLRLEDSDFEEVVLDFEGVNEINSLAMGSIFALVQTLQVGERTLRIRNTNEMIARLLRIATLDTFIQD